MPPPKPWRPPASTTTCVHANWSYWSHPTENAATYRALRRRDYGDEPWYLLNWGFFDSMECLAFPVSCIPEYPVAGPSFLGEDLAGASVKNGYARTFYPGPPAMATAGSGVSSTSMTSFAYVAEPQLPGQSGLRAFCGDSTGRVCATPSGEMPPVVDGVCPLDCPDVR